MISNFVTWIGNRAKRHNKNALGAICGATGSGKSYAGMRFCESLDPTFTIDRIAFTPIEFMKLVNDKKIKKGMAIMWDESGVGYDARSFATKTNKILNHIMETFRNKNLIIVMTTPSLDFIDVNARKLLHFYFETVNINEEKKKVMVKPFMVSNNPRMGKYYMQYPIRAYRGKGVKITRIGIGLPSKGLIKAYEIKKRGFTDALNKEVLEKLELASKPKEVKAVFDPRAFADKVRAANWDKVTIPKIRAEFGLSVHKAQLVRSLIL